jgi:hypothetical protein
MATLLCRDKDIGYTILPYPRSMKPVQLELIAHPSDYVLGYITNNENTDVRKFTYTESGRSIPVNRHWSLDIMKEFPYCEQNGSWILYSCSPERTTLEFLKICPNESLHIHNWDTWSVKGKNAKVAVVTSWEIY